mmetsp:Transcript_17064/g.36942  ORF Transcript_17064/g.36942 Transcript_17064/m.36942 type:complete len:438 (+) Transcript_17064:770-2083(+)
MCDVASSESVGASTFFLAYWMYFLMKSAVKRSWISSPGASVRASTRAYISVLGLEPVLELEAAEAPTMPDMSAGGGAKREQCCRSTWCEMRRSLSASFLSRMTKSKSKRESSESGIAIFCIGGMLGLYEPKMGLAAATTAQRALSEAWIPALEMVTVCCSITSWIATRSASSILSNSSTQQTPRSASTMAPASSRRVPVSESTVTAAVSPTPDEPRPVVEMASGAVRITARSSCDLAVPGSPSMSTLMSPRRWVPLARLRSAPPRSMSSSARFSYSWPKMEGASDSESCSRQSDLRERPFIFSMSSAVNSDEPVCLVSETTLLPMTMVRNMPDWLDLEGSARWMPATCSLSPGLAVSTRSASSNTSIERGSWPGGARSGISCSVTTWLSRYSERPNSVSRGLPSWSFCGYAEPVIVPVSEVWSRYSLDVYFLVAGHQ